MPHAVAVSTGAQRLDNQTVLTYDVLVVSDSIPDGGSTYVASAVPVDIEALTIGQIHQAVADQLAADVQNQTGVAVDASDLLFPARAKG